MKNPSPLRPCGVSPTKVIFTTWELWLIIRERITGPDYTRRRYRSHRANLDHLGAAEMMSRTVSLLRLNLTSARTVTP